MGKYILSQNVATAIESVPALTGRTRRVLVELRPCHAATTRVTHRIVCAYRTKRAKELPCYTDGALILAKFRYIRPPQLTNEERQTINSHRLHWIVRDRPRHILFPLFVITKRPHHRFKPLQLRNTHWFRQSASLLHSAPGAQDYPRARPRRSPSSRRPRPLQPPPLPSFSCGPRRTA